MASSTASQSDTVDKVQLKVMVDKKNKRVLWVEADKDFVDVLFSFLTLPLGTIARLVSQKSNSEPARIGSLSSLYQSVADLKEERFWTKTCKEMLLRPRNSMEAYCQNLKVKIDDTPMEYFFCGKSKCGGPESDDSTPLLTTFRNQQCSCGDVMQTEVSLKSLGLQNGFVKPFSSFIICDDLHVIPNAFGTSVLLLQKFGIQNINSVEEQSVDIDKKEVFDLLKLSFFSKTPLIDLILRKKEMCSYLYHRNQYQSHFAIRKETSANGGRKMSVKVTIRKSTGEVLFVEGEEDFADFILSFLTFPLGAVIHMLEASSSLCCFDNLYKSLCKLNPDKILLSIDVKDKLTKPQCFPTFELTNQILPIGVASFPEYYCHTYKYNTYAYNGVNFTKEKGNLKFSRTSYPFVPFKLVDPKFSISKSARCGEFIGPSLYMVTDDLVVTQMSSSPALSHLNKSNVSLSDLEERVIEIGKNEGLSILKASLISTSALTNGLKPFISIVKEENPEGSSVGELGDMQEGGPRFEPW